MKSTIYASFVDASDAEKAAGALLDHGLAPVDLTLLAHPDYEPTRNSAIASAAERSREENEIEAHEVTGTSVGFPAADTTGRTPSEPQGNWSIPGGHMAYGAEMAGGIESTDAATQYPGSDDALIDGDRPAKSIPNYTETSPEIADPLQKQHLSASSSLTTTTASDVGSGALKGVAVGIGLGVLASLAAVFIPGVGIVLGSGALALALEATAATAGAGAIAGGVVGLLKDQGIPDDVVVVYRDAVDQGGAMLAVGIPDNVDRSEIQAVLAKYGAQNIELYFQA